jgi:hypothetical protein
MRLKEFATPDAQLELWKMVSDAVWSAINKQNSQQRQSTAKPQQDPAAVSRAQDAKPLVKPAPALPKPKLPPKKKGAAKKSPKIPVPPVRPPQPLKPKARTKPKQVATARTQASAVPVSQRQQLAANGKPIVTTPQSPIPKTPSFDAKTGVFHENPKLLKQTQKGG